jgi:diguanylate cyclase (GGDEF)-like protein/PAS domain S-box-containing protein
VSLRFRTLLIVLATSAGLGLALYLFARGLLVESFAKLEEREARQHLERARAALDDDLDSLSALSFEYAAWTLTWDYMRTRDRSFVDSELPRPGSTRMRLHVVALFDESWVLAHGHWMTEAEGSQTPLDEAAAADLARGLKAAAARGRTAMRGRGIVRVGGRPLLVGFWPILHTGGGGPSRGLLALGRYLDEVQVASLSDRTRLELRVEPAPPVLDSVEPTVVVISDQRLRMQTLVTDLQGNPSVLLQVVIPRSIHAQGRTTLFYLLVSLIASAIAFSAVTLLLVERTVLARLAALERGVAEIAALPQAEARVAVSGQDELSRLASAVNTMLKSLEGSQASLRRSEERYDHAVRAANDGIWDWNLETGDVFFSPRWKEMLGLEGESLAPVPGTWLDRVHPDDASELKGRLDELRHGTAGHLEHEHRVKHGDGGYRYMLCRAVSVSGAEGPVGRLVGSLTDISDRKSAEARLVREALYDNLTGLPNRTLLMDRLAQSLAAFRREPERPPAVLFVDLDRFKVVNDSLGHKAGDELLQEASRRLRACARPADTVARLGGDEFVMLVERIRNPTDAVHVAERVQADLLRPVRVAGQDVFVSASIGIGIAERGGGREPTPESLLSDADLAMYRAKTQGRSRHQLFEPEMHARAMSQLELESGLRRALEREEFRLVYQPIVELRDGRLVGFEALIRWERPGHGLVSPAEFVPQIEENGQIVPVGRWVLRTACREAARWPRPPAGPRVSVNVSGRQLLEPTLVADVEQALLDSGLPADSLVLEITETVFFQGGDRARPVLNALRRLGVGLAMDDFGTGYSSLSFLRLYPIDRLKIDRSFVWEMADDERTRRVVAAVIRLAGALGMDAVAEGVETEGQRRALVQMGCRLGQGFFFARPHDSETALALATAAESSPLLPARPDSPVESGSAES